MGKEGSDENPFVKKWLRHCASSRFSVVPLVDTFLAAGLLHWPRVIAACHLSRGITDVNIM
jgi:hypothetical protein